MKDRANSTTDSSTANPGDETMAEFRWFMLMCRIVSSEWFCRMTSLWLHRRPHPVVIRTTSVEFPMQTRHYPGPRVVVWLL